jgi:hypothetical protein
MVAFPQDIEKDTQESSVFAGPTIAAQGVGLPTTCPRVSRVANVAIPWPFF